jgi:DNA-binding GntR family transcriptional regulator
MPRRARYREIADDLRQRLAAGEWPVGSYMPGITALQLQYDVPGLNTIRQAQSLLQQEGLIEARQGRGTFVIALPEQDDRAELRQLVVELQQAVTSMQVTLSRVARQLGGTA